MTSVSIENLFTKKIRNVEDVFNIIENRPGKIATVPKSLIDAQDEAGWTPLMYAAFCREARVIDHLLDAGADKYKVNDADLYAYDYAYLGRPEISEKTLQKLAIN